MPILSKFSIEKIVLITTKKQNLFYKNKRF